MKIRKYISISVIIIFVLIVFYYSVTILRAKRLNIWLGKYEYSEFYEHISAEEIHYVIDYEIIIFEIEGKYYAMITGDGWFTNTRLLGYVKGNRNSIDIFFKDTLPWDNLYQNGVDRYEKDELLITLSYVGSELHTSWHALRNAYPTLCDIEGEIEGVYFE